MYLDVEQRLAELVEAESPEAVDGRVAQQAFPDLRAWRDAQGRTRWCSVEATPKADQLGFWSDDAGRVWATPYLVQAGAVIFSDPPEICVGRWVSAGFGVDPEPGWEDVVAALRLNDGVVKGVRNYLGLHPPISWEKEIVKEPLDSGNA